MPRALTGGIQSRHLKSGVRHYLRVTAYGRRYCLTLGGAADEWTEERCERYRAALIDDIKAGRWEPPPPRERRSRAQQLSSAPRPVDATHAYSHIRKAAHALETVRDSAASSVARLAVREALTALYVAEDAVGRAIRERTTA